MRTIITIMYQITICHLFVNACICCCVNLDVLEGKINVNAANQLKLIILGTDSLWPDHDTTFSFMFSCSFG